jgi:cytochrome b pre-mRNA-processing protein 3
LTPLDRLMRWRSEASTTEKLYGAIVAQARLPVFYRSFGVRDTLQGRFTLLALHLFAVLHRLQSEGLEGRALAQELVDRCSQDMETVLRELGVGDLRVPKAMRRLAAASKGLFQDYEAALAGGEEPLAHAIAASLPAETESPEVSSRALASYLLASIEALARQDIASLRAGALEFPEASIEP